MEPQDKCDISVSTQESLGTKEKNAHSVRNVNARQIFKNAKLTSQFLRNYTELPLFANVTPEDIEDVTDHYRAYLGVEFESDIVKRVRVRLDGKEQHVYVIPLIEHKSYVDHDVAMQLLRYMALIWYEYAKEQNALQRNISHTKSFRYPLIIPIVYYEGAARWTADQHLSSRIEGGSTYRKYIPDFAYKIVQICDYTNEELQKKHDEMSLVMLFNKIQTPQDYSDFMNNMEAFVDSVYGNAPEDIKQVVMEVLWSLFIKMNLPVDEAQKMVEEVEKSGMGYLFENFEKCDIQEERRKTKEAQEKLKEASEDAEEARADAKEARAQRMEIESMLILGLQKEGCTKEEALKKLQDTFGFEASEAQRMLATYWK